MSTQIDNTVFSVVLVLGVLGIGLFAKNIQIIAIGALALLVLLLMAKIVYFEAPVVFAMIALGVLAIYGNTLQEAAGSAFKFIDGEEVKEDKFRQEIIKAYAEQYAPENHFITVDWDYATRLFQKCGVNEPLKGFLFDKNSAVLVLGGADTIEDIRILSKKPLSPCEQLNEVISNRRIWVKVKVGDREDIWVKVKAYVSIVSWKNDWSWIQDDVDGAVWAQPISIFDKEPLYREVYFTKGDFDAKDLSPFVAAKIIPVFGTLITIGGIAYNVWQIRFSGLMKDKETDKILAVKVDKKSKYWPYVIAEV